MEVRSTVLTGGIPTPRVPRQRPVDSCRPPSSGPPLPIGEFRFAPVAEDPEVSFSLRAEISGVKRLVLAKPVQKPMDGEMAALDTAKASIEGS